MEFTGAGRLEVRITAHDVGKRVSIRRLTAPGGEGERFTDTVGVLTSWDNGVLLITRKSGETVPVAEASLVAGKVVPPAPARRRGPAADFRELSRAADRAWPPQERTRVGEWELRAAGGFTRRANSALTSGDPGLPLDEALSRVVDWYGERGLPARIHAATGAAGTQEPLCAALEERGWRREVSVEFRIASLAPLADRDADVSRVALDRSFDDAWLKRYRGTAGATASIRAVLGGGPSLWFASVAGEGKGEGEGRGKGQGEGRGKGQGEDRGEVPAAIGRCAVDGRWAGFMALEVDPALRRQGLAGAMTTALARRALAEGASAAWLQVETDNEGARALYDRLGFTTHHHYHYYLAP
ncbi:GNAT family N-acetyltransferase [Streptomyces sp. NPDC000594]|uniref:GNAT family N-acetyltransferase n=1 Tax=Streptomyces sp. NPDC000594 TaxID=3154261 RepID=UPI00332ACB18